MLEKPGSIEPCFFEERIPVDLADLSVEIQRDSIRLGQGLHPDSAAELADLVRVKLMVTDGAFILKPKSAFQR
jgi:hypothetical protein